MLIQIHIFGWARSEMGVASLVMDPYNWLYLMNESMEWNDFMQAGANSGKKGYFNNFRMGVVRNGSGYLVYETLQSAVS